MPSERRSPSEGSARSGHSSHSRRDRASESMGLDGGEAGRRIAAEDEYIRRELMETTAFCNAFWGSEDVGYDVIQSRMKGAQRTLDDLKALYKERADIEAEYSKRLSKLARFSLGRDETGALRAALDTVKAELDATSRTHLDLANMIKKDLEGNVSDFQAKANQARKNSQASIEKLHKNKQTQEQYVNKSREKYEQDCIKINGYTAQSSLVQGKDLDKVAYKLDKAQATVAQNDKDYQNFVRALKDTTVKWNAEWKSYLDQCQDLEEERIDFMKSNLWNFANAVSAICVADDESCERVRVSLETVETPRDIQFFIQHCGTGSMIPTAPEYINYAKGQPPPPRPTYQTARFQRNTTRPAQLPISPAPAASQPPPPPPHQEQTVQSVPPPAKPTPSPSTDDRRRSQGPSQPPATYRGPPQPGYQNGADSGHPSGAPFKPPPGSVALPGMSVPPEASQDVPQPSEMRTTPSHEKRMSARNFLARTSSLSHASKTQPPKPLGSSAAGPNGGPSYPASTQDPQQLPNASGITASDSNSSAPADDEDPIAKALASLRMRPGGRSPGPQSPNPHPSRRNTNAHEPPASYQPGHTYAPSQSQSQSQSQMHSQHYASQPPQPPVNRAPSPSPSQGFPQRARSPSAAFMQAPQRAASPLPVEDVVGHYGQSFPGERKSLSRQNSTASRMSMQPSVSAPMAHPRSPANQEQGFAGVGARGRSPSPQPYARQHQQPSAQAAPAAASAAEDARRRANPPPRSTTPLGISLDATGSVTHDQMAEEYIRRSGSVPPVQAPGGSIHAGQLPPQRPPSAAPVSASMAPSGYHLNQASMHHQQHQQQQQYGGAPVQRPPSVQGQHYSYQGAAPSAHQPYQSQHSIAATTAGPPASMHPSQQSSLYGQAAAAPQHQPVSADPRAYGGGYASPASYSQQAPGPRPAASQSLPAHLAQQQYGGGSRANMASPAPAAVPSHHQPQQQQQQQQQPPPSGYYNPPAQAQQDTPAAAYMHQYQQQHGLPAATPTSSQVQQPSMMGMYQQPLQQVPPPQQQQQQQPPPPQHLQQQSSWSMAGPGSMRSPSPGVGATQPLHQMQGPPPNQQQQQQQQAPQHVAMQQAQQPTSAPSAGAQAGQPHPPTGQFSDSGRPILFYVKALYDYHATMEEEFSFTAGDIIAVTHTEADGWWQGELLDEARRRPGANTFPSNFVQLLM